MHLLLFVHVDGRCPSRTVTLDPDKNHSHHYWHVFVPRIEVGQIDDYRVERFCSAIGACFWPKMVKTFRAI